MDVVPLPVLGAAHLTLVPRRDERGSFARAWDAAVLREHGLDPTIAQMNLSTNVEAGTLRGLHVQLAPHAEAKLFRCVAGRTFHVTVDLRPDSPTFGRWAGVELSAERGDAMFMPAGTAAGYQALTDGAAVLYTASTSYAPGCERGVRWDDPLLDIAWPMPIEAATLTSDKDRAWPLLTDLASARDAFAGLSGLLPSTLPVGVPS